mgnify:FL=1
MSTRIIRSLNQVIDYLETYRPTESVRKEIVALRNTLKREERPDNDKIERYVMRVIDSWPEEDVKGYAIERMLSYYINSATTDELLQFFDNPERNIWKLRQLQSQNQG